MPEFLKKIIVTVIIGGLCISAFFIYLNNFKKPTPRTVDEVVYYMMARQLEDNILDYNASSYVLHNSTTDRRDLPDYFYQPLFKHPPLFTLLILVSVKVFGSVGQNPLGAVFFPILMGALSIALIYLLGKMVGGRAVGLLAAGMMFIDPVLIMSSQKVWMDTPLMFFMLLTVYCYWKAIRESKNMFFIFGGIAAGLAVMVKYPGILSFLIVIFFVILSAPNVFKNRYFLLSLFLPVLISVPWILMNFYVYGSTFISKQLALHHFNHIFSKSFLVFGVMILTIAWLGVMMCYRPQLISKRFALFLQKKPIFYFKLLAWAGVFLFVALNISKSLNFFEIPWVTWQQSSFSGQPGWFYLQRLLRFSFLYGFAYLAFFDPFHKTSNELFLIKLNAFIMMLFFVAWGNFQCRYILPAVPFLLIMSADYIWKLFGRFAQINYVHVRLLFQALLLILIVLAVSKTMLINYEVSYTNDMCYF